MEQSDLLVVAFSLAGLTYFLSPLMMNFHKKEFVAWGITLRNDALIAMVGIGAVSAIRLLLEFVQKLVAESAGSSLTTSNVAYSAVMGQLVGIEIALVSIMAIITPIPVLQGFSIMLGHVLGPAVSSVTGSIILWLVLQSLSNVIPTLFLTLFSTGLVLWSIPFRIGRGAGSHLMALSMVLFIGLPLVAPISIWVEGYVLTSTDLNNLTGLPSTIPTNHLDPSFLSNFLITNIAELIARVIAGVAIALIVFPAMYLALLGIFTGGIARLIGGSSGGLPVGL